MNKLVLLTLAIVVMFATYDASAQSGLQLQECLVKAKSCYLPQANIQTQPEPFEQVLQAGKVEVGNNWWPGNRPAISTGYYFVTNRSKADDIWRPRASEFVDITTDAARWITIDPGPRLQIGSSTFWDSNNNTEGAGNYWFFRNPADDNPSTPQTIEYFVKEYEYADYNISTPYKIDSTDDAIAGPIKLGLSGGFKFNGIRYDSFYVSTNGLVALTNRRYNYASDGSRAYGTDGTTYDPMSMDWFARTRSGDGMNDLTKDDYGFRYSILNNDPSSPQAGIRARGFRKAGLDGGNISYNKTAVIAPFWGDLELNQFAKDDINNGKVMYYRSINSDKLYIYFINAQPKGSLSTQQCGDFTNPRGLRPGETNYISANAQIILDNKENDIMIIYRSFQGSAGPNIYCTEQAQKIFLKSTVSGVRGFARHINYNRKTPEVLTEYEQFTHFWVNESNPDADYPNSTLLVRYKQWPNALRVVNIQYRVRDKTLDPIYDDLSFKVRVKETQNYELLAGEPRLGAIQPVALIQNLTNDIQGQNGINYVAQDLEFRAMFKIVNKASGRVVYQKETVIDSTCMALPEAKAIDCTGDRDVRIRLSKVETTGGTSFDITAFTPTADNPNAPLQFPDKGPNTESGNPYGGVPPYGFVELYFPPWSPSEFLDDHIGRLEAYVIAIPRRPNLSDIKDEWPFDDTTSVNLFVLKRLETFYDDGNEFHLIDGTPMPSVWKWVNIDAEMVSGDDVSKHPLPPRGQFSAVYVDSPPEKKWLQEKINAANAYKLNSPVIKMNRKTLLSQEPATSPGGDEIRSFPVNMIGRKNSILSVAVQRTQYDENWERGWSDAKLIGPEPRTILNDNIFNVYNNRQAGSYKPDELVVEYANSWVDQNVKRLYHVTNIDPKQWRIHFRRDKAPTETKVPVLRVYGAGGYAVGFLEEDPDSALADPAEPALNSLRANKYDDGMDLEYKKYFLAIPDTFVNMPFNTSENFRFRIRVMAGDDGLLAKMGATPSIPDDDDDYFVDNVRILFQDIEATDIEVSAVKMKWPFNRVPASQATKIPISVSLTNNTAIGAPTYFAKVEIFKNGDDRPIYCRYEIISVHNGGEQLIKALPAFNARNAGPGNYRIRAVVILRDDSDKDPRNDTTYSDYKIEFGDDFALDPIQNPTSNVSNLTRDKIPGRGLNLFGYNSGGTKWSYDSENFAAGYLIGTGSGQIGVRFDLQNADTIKGYKAFFGGLSQSQDGIAFTLYDDASGIPGREIANSRIDRKRGVSDVLFDKLGNPIVTFNDYVEYKTDKEIVLQPGNYWVVIAQLGQDPIHLGASSARGGMRTMNIYDMPGEPLGLSGIHLALNKEFRNLNTNGDKLLNDNRFAYENSKGSGEWVRFMPNSGNPGYAHLHHMGFSPVDNITMTLSRGFWIPLLRPVLGAKSYITNPLYDECVLPIELSEFDGVARNNRIELFWKTSSEIDNKGFYVERKLSSEKEESWNQLGWVNGRGKGNYTAETKYSFVDNKVKPNVSYDYRLRQVDIDGAFNCEASGIVTKTLIQDMPLSLELTSKNPFETNVSFNVSSPKSGDMTVEVVDMYGNVVYQFVNKPVNAGVMNFTWEANSQTGAKVANGAYIIRASLNGNTVSEKVSVVR